MDSSQVRWLLVMLSVASSLLILGSCANTTKTSAPIDMATASRDTTYCRVDALIGWSKRDTDQTIADIKVHNAKYRATCK